MNIDNSSKPYLRFKTRDQLQSYLARAGHAEFDFRTHPIFGAPENFHYSGREKVITRENDQKFFDSLDDFTCYAFQCDAEGYSNTEYIDFELLN
ncbi:hypothetical protein SPSYN_01842 [Sporotomaculum syntrophicum]|uniref:Uncharacterized protein n=1 Tax=Sporotomaculum syntrophicum TaxID=182264 RepID=A0A9D2WRQ2_9FIRM|nr:hypothetical protein [Sporotomaculum syntrophicum]KAF1085696.1 hypothetical protein SPSYN_01842 [Sporotomaculum syntrophicum]